MGLDSQKQKNKAAELLFNEPLSHYTTWRVGGLAKRLYKPAGVEDLVQFLKQVPENEAILFLGLGSNSLIKDGGFNGTVVLTQSCVSEMELLDSNTLRIEAGVSCAKLARFAARNNLAGAEFWAGIPGTMGGALRMNAGCYNGETWNFVREVETINRKGEIRRRKADEFSIAYRHMEGLEKDEWFLSATCYFEPGDKEHSLATIKELLARRSETQPTSEYNCGSVFRNPSNHYAAKLIESCLLKGKRLGGAMVSEKHANFIINDKGSASAQDIESLIDLVKNTVYQQTGIELLREVHIIGENACQVSSS